MPKTRITGPSGERIADVHSLEGPLLDLAAGFWKQGNGDAMLVFSEGKRHRQLLVIHHDKLGFYLKFHDRALGSWMSCADRNRLKQVVEIYEDIYASEGLFVPGALAWEAVKEFSEKGRRSKKVDWIRQKDMPPEGNW